MLTQINVLFVEDDEEDHLLIRDSLSKVSHSEFTLKWVADFDAGLEAITSGGYDVCLVNHRLGNRDGFEFIREATSMGCRIPIIFLTAWHRFETDLLAIKEGAPDYLVKGQITPLLLERSIQYAIDRNQKEREILKYQEELERLAKERTAELTRVKEEAFKKAEEAEEGKRILDALLEHIPEGITITGGPPDYLIKFVSRTGQDLTGKSKDEIVGMPAGDHVNVWGLYSPDGVTQPTPKQSTLYRAARFGETVIDEEWVLKRPDGRSIPILCNVAPIRNETGEIIGGIKAFRDITDRKRAEEALRKSEEKYRTLFDQSVEGIYLHDLEGNILDVNRIAVLQSGYSKEELLRMNVLDLLPGKKESEDILRQWKEWPAEQRFTFKIKHGRKDGIVFPVEVTTGKVTFVDRVLLLAIVQDITERKRAEEELRRAHDELELRVEERTSELKSSNRALGEYAAKLERLNQELQEFAFVASHDLQEPLRKIQMFSDLLKNPRGSFSEEQRRDYFERMQSAAERMRTMINALLEYSRVTTKGQSFTEVCLSESAKKALQVLDLKVEETGARVHIADLPEVEADPFQMVQLFQNLIENALKFHKTDIPPEVTIHSEPVEKDQIRIVVEDNGIGFDEKNLSRLFIPFERLHGAEFRGTGIGLAICRKLVERHGGTITAKSSPGKGSTFIIDLPVKQKYEKNENRPPHGAT